MRRNTLSSAVLILGAAVSFLGCSGTTPAERDQKELRTGGATAEAASNATATADATRDKTVIYATSKREKAAEAPADLPAPQQVEVTATGALVNGKALSPGELQSFLEGIAAAEPKQPLLLTQGESGTPALVDAAAAAALRAGCTDVRIAPPAPPAAPTE